MCLVCLCKSVNNAHKTMAKNELINELLKDYNNKVAPSTPVTINILVVIDDLIEVNEKDETIKVALFLGKYWSDVSLSWNPDKYANITMLSIPCGDIWKPDIWLRSVTDRAEMVHDIDVVNVMVDFHGNVLFTMPEISTVRCPMDLSSFPFDKQLCKLQVCDIH